MQSVISNIHHPSTTDECGTPTSDNRMKNRDSENLATPSTMDFGTSSVNSVDCSTDSISHSDHADNASASGMYSSYFDKPEPDLPGSPSISPETPNWGELTSATAALLDPNVLRMFVDSLTRSIARSESQSILEVGDHDNHIRDPAPQVSTPMSRVSTPMSVVSSHGSSEPPGLPEPTNPLPFARSTTNMSIISNQTGYDTNAASSTVMLRNVPYDARQRGVLTVIEEEGFQGLFDFFYAPLDFKSKNNLGYAFVNLKSLQIAKDFFKRFDGRRVASRPGWDKPLRVCWARVQGLEANIDHYRNSPVNEMPSEFKPMLFDLDGEPAPFPAPDVAREESRRSCHLRNGGAVSTVRPRERRLQSQLSRGFLTPVNAAGGSSLSAFALTKTPQPSSSVKLFVGGLGPDTTSDALEEYMGRFGAVEDCHVLIDGQTGRSRCYGFCTFASAEGAAAALGFAKSHIVDGRGVVVRPYTSGRAAAA